MPCCGADLDCSRSPLPNSGPRGNTLACTGMTDLDAIVSSPDELDSSSDVSRCVPIDPMSRPVLCGPTSMCGADLDGSRCPLAPLSQMAQIQGNRYEKPKYRSGTFRLFDSSRTVPKWYLFKNNLLSHSSRLAVSHRHALCMAERGAVRTVLKARQR